MFAKCVISVIILLLNRYKEYIVDTKKRPVFLDLTKMRFPPTAIVSILHRVSGVLLFLLLPFALHLLHCSLVSEDSFETLQQWLQQPLPAFALWVMLCAAGFHLLAGIRHMLMDCGLGEGLCAAKFSAYLLIALEVVVMVLAGVWLW